ncbi:MATE family efflux transporter [Nonomuraea sp. NPDC003201]
MLAVGAPSFLAGFGATLLAALINMSLAATGAVVLAAYAVCARLQTFVFTPQIGITQAIQPIVGYNAGRGLTGRVDRTLTLAMRATVIYGAVTAALIALLAQPLVGLFIGDQATTAVTVDALRVIAIGFVFAGVPPLISAYFQSLGKAAPSYLISIGTLMVIKVPLVLALGMSGPAGIWISLPIGEAISVVAAVVLLRRFGKPGTRVARAAA